MKKITFLLAVLITSLSFAQQGINYKAVIKDGGGAVVANTQITVQFIIGTGLLVGNLNTIVYQETHMPTTDANGIIILNIGEGSVDSGVFADIDWSVTNYLLDTQIDTGSGLTAMGRSYFKAVPYALHAANVSGLEKVGQGYRLIGRDPANHGSLGSEAVDLSYSFINGDYGATGEYSLAMGSNTQATYYHATAMGYNTTASSRSSTAMGDSTMAYGNSSTAMGSSTTASGTSSTAMGSSTTASGEGSTAMGKSTKAEALSTTAIGQYNVGTGDALTWEETDPLFEIGNGADEANRSNALTVLKNGTITAPSFDISEITENKALITKEYADTNYSGTGLEAIDEGNGIGYRLIGRNPISYGDIGYNAIDFSVPYNLDDGATGRFSLAAGLYARASGDYSHSLGYSAYATGNYATSIGNYIYARSFNSFVIGRNNIGGGTTDSWVATDPLFEIGNGGTTGVSSQSNALTVYKNGNTDINGDLTVSGTITATEIIEADTVLTLETGYTHYGSIHGSVTYYKDNERVYIEGLVTGTNIGVVGYLPVGYRPSKRLLFNANTQNTNVRVDIATDGSINLMDVPPGTWFSLSGINFRAVN